MLAPSPADEQRRHQQADAAAEAGEAIAEAGQRGAERQHDRRAEPLGQEARGNLKTGERPENTVFISPSAA